MKESKQVKERICKHCKQTMMTDAKTIKTHAEQCFKIIELRKKVTVNG